MKRFALAVLAFAASMPLWSATIAKGEIAADAGIGVGAMSAGGSTGAFTQRLAIETGIWEFNMLNSDWTMTLGFQFNNGVHRSSVISADIFNPANQSKFTYVHDDLTMMPTVSIHHGFADNLDAYATFGMGLGLINFKESVDGWSRGNTTASFAMALNLGARYWFNRNWAANAQFGLVSATWKHSYGSYNILSVGVTYRF